MNSTIFEFLAVTSLVYLGLFVVGAPLSLGLRLRGSLFIILSPIVGAAVTEVFAWYVLDFSDIGLHAALPWLMGGCVLAIAAIWLVGRQKKTLKSHSHIWESDDLRSLALTTALVTTTFSLHARWLLGFSRLTIGVIGNNDVASYATLARHVSMNGFANAGYIAQDHLGSRARADVSGMFSLFSQATWITGRWEWEVAMPVLLVATLLVAQGLCFLLCRTVHLGWISSALLATISVNTFLFAYISWNYFIAQLFAMATLPIFLYLLQRGEADIGRLRALIITAILVIHLLLVYPHMTFLLLPVLVVMSTLNTGSPVGLLSRAGASVRLLSGGLLLGAAVVPTRFLDSIERTILLKDIVAGWPLTEILPWALVGFQTSFRATSTPWVVVASALLVWGCLNAWRRHLLNNAATTFPLVGIVVVVLTTYTAFCYLNDEGYAQWKWISFFQPLLAVSLIAPLALYITTKVRLAPLRVARALPIVALGALLVASFNNARVATRAIGTEGRSLWVSEELADLSEAPALNGIEELDIATDPWWDTMWATVILAPRTLHLRHDYSYFNRSPDLSGTTLLRSDTAAKAPWLESIAVNDAYVLLPSSPQSPDSTLIDGLAAETTVNLYLGQEGSVSATVSVTNTGDAHWLGTRSGAAGEVNLGIQALDINKIPIVGDYARFPLAPWPLWVPPKATVTTDFTLPMTVPDGTHFLRFVPVAEHVAWFDGLGTKPVDVGQPQPNSTEPSLLGSDTTAQVTIDDTGNLVVAYSVTNTGSAHWLGSGANLPGETNLGVQLLDVDGALLAADWVRIPLVPWPLSIAPGQTVSGSSTLPQPPEHTRFFKFIPVAEQVSWFDGIGSSPVVVDNPLQ